MDHSVKEMDQMSIFNLKYRGRGHIFRELMKQRATCQAGELGCMKYEMCHYLWLASSVLHYSYMFNKPEMEQRPDCNVIP